MIINLLFSCLFIQSAQAIEMSSSVASLRNGSVVTFHLMPDERITDIQSPGLVLDRLSESERAVTYLVRENKGATLLHVGVESGHMQKAQMKHTWNLEPANVERHGWQLVSSVEGPHEHGLFTHRAQMSADGAVSLSMLPVVNPSQVKVDFQSGGLPNSLQVLSLDGKALLGAYDSGRHRKLGLFVRDLDIWTCKYELFQIERNGSMHMASAQLNWNASVIMLVLKDQRAGEEPRFEIRSFKKVGEAYVEEIVGTLGGSLEQGVLPKEGFVVNLSRSEAFVNHEQEGNYAYVEVALSGDGHRIWVLVPYPYVDPSETKPIYGRILLFESVGGESFSLKEDELLRDLNMKATHLTTSFDGSVVICAELSNLERFFHAQLTDQGLVVKMESFKRDRVIHPFPLSETLTNAEIFELQRHEMARDLQLSPDGQFLVAAYPEGTLNGEEIAFAMLYWREGPQSWVPEAFFSLGAASGYNYELTASLSSDARAIGLTSFDSVHGRDEWKAWVFKSMGHQVKRPPLVSREVGL